MDEDAVVARGQHPHRFAGQVVGVGLALLGRERREADPAALLLAHRIGAFGRRDRGRRVVELEAQTPEDVAIAQYRMPQRRRAGSALADEVAFLGVLLADAGDGDAVQAHDVAEHLGTDHAMHVGHSVDAHALRLAGQPPHPHQRMVAPLGVGFEKLDVQPFEERPEKPRRGYGNAQLRIRRAQCAQRMGQHRHIAHGRGADDQQMSRQFFTFCHRAPG